jgi:1,2-phenylacetyl-CoA epoxidase catalytic subunit
MSPSATPAAAPDTAARACMISLIGSLADNKAALGRRYAEWAISAPTLESAVAAAAMAQDELGHARATYPVLKVLGAEIADEGHVHGHPLALLDDPLPDWTSLIAANLLVDGVLTTFVAACAGSSIGPLDQRARKILQEEGSHRVHAEAWARRLCRSGGEGSALAERLHETWAHAGRWLGPAGDPGYAAALDRGMVLEDQTAQRERIRGWLTGLLGAEGVRIELADPVDWSGWDPDTRRWTP